LIFLGFQVRSNIKATQASTFHQIAALDINILLSLGHTKESSRIISTFRGNPDALSEEEQDQGFHLFVQKFAMLRIYSYRTKTKC
jgi:hypothetical protein